MEVYFIDKKTVEKEGLDNLLDIWTERDDGLDGFCVDTNYIPDDDKVIFPRIGEKVYSPQGLYVVIDVITWMFSMDSAIFIVEPVSKKKKI